jgi:hypothetical protein
MQLCTDRRQHLFGTRLLNHVTKRFLRRTVDLGKRIQSSRVAVLFASINLRGYAYLDTTLHDATIMVAFVRLLHSRSSYPKHTRSFSSAGGGTM